MVAELAAVFVGYFFQKTNHNLKASRCETAVKKEKA